MTGYKDQQNESSYTSKMKRNGERKKHGYKPPLHPTADDKKQTKKKNKCNENKIKPSLDLMNWWTCGKAVYLIIRDSKKKYLSKI